MMFHVMFGQLLDAIAGAQLLRPRLHHSQVVGADR